MHPRSVGVRERDANKQERGRENGDGGGGPFYRRAAAGESRLGAAS